MSPKVQKLIDDLAKEFSLDSHRKEQLARRVKEAVAESIAPEIFPGASEEEGA